MRFCLRFVLAEAGRTEGGEGVSESYDKRIISVGQIEARIAALNSKQNAPLRESDMIDEEIRALRKVLALAVEPLVAPTALREKA